MEKNLYNKTSFVSLLLIIAIVISFHLACHDDIIVEPPVAFLAGTVVDSLSSAPIESAWVSLLDSAYNPLVDVLSDSAGYYVTLIGVPGVRDSAFCGRQGYITQMRVFSVAPGDTAIVNFKLPRR